MVPELEVRLEILRPRVALHRFHHQLYENQLQEKLVRLKSVGQLSHQCLDGQEWI